MRRLVFGVVVWGVQVWAAQVWAATDFSPSFLGMYRKTMEVERELFAHAGRHGVDPRLVRALIMHESGGNAQLVSKTGRRGYFQLEAADFQQGGVATQIEVGIKILSQLADQVRREDLVLAGFQARSVRAGDVDVNGQPLFDVNSGHSNGQHNEQGKTLRLESLEYVRQVEQYKSVLVLHEAAVRHQAELLRLRQVSRGDSWPSLARATGVPERLLRLYNPVLSAHPLQADTQIVYPPLTPPRVFQYTGASLAYTAREGDSMFSLARVFEVDVEALRQSNDLWRLQPLEAGTSLTVHLPSDSPFSPAYAALPESAQQLAMKESSLTPLKPPTQSVERSIRHKTRSHTVQAGETLTQIASRYRISVQALMQANAMQTSHIVSGAELRVPQKRQHERRQKQRLKTQSPRQSVGNTYRVYTVQRGDTLVRIARRYGISVRSLMLANRLSTSKIRPGISLRIPGTNL